MAIARASTPKGRAAVATDLLNRFTYHAPKEGQPQIYEAIRQMGHDFAIYLDAVVPDSREKSLAFTAIEEAVMWAIAAEARHG